MDVEEVIDEVLEIERSMRMDMGQLVGEEEVIPSHVEIPHPEVGQIVTVETEATDESDEAGSSDTQSTDAEQLSPMGDSQEVTFVVQLNDEGAFLLDRSGIVPSATKVKSTENPLVGAKHFPTTRSRKTKPQAILYNDEIDQIYEMLPDGSLNSITTSRGEDVTPVGEVVLGESMEISDFASRLLPKDFELMENLLANQEVLEISGPTKPTSSERKIQTVEVHYDHNYSAYPFEPSRPRSKTVITVISDGHAKIPMHQMPMPKHAAVEPYFNYPATSEDDVHLGPEYWEIPIPENEESKLPAKTPEGVSPGISSSEASAQARRSQRQQDRIERQEAERILAENQKMLQREKELYGKGPISPSTATTTTSPPAALQPATDILPSLAPVDKPLVTTPVSSKGKGKAQPSEEDSNSSRRPYPKRQNRKLPAHLADPNYINLDESERKSNEGVIENENVDGEDEEEGDGEKEISEDDPNKLWCICRKPHNNRFMICCDTCEDWFHGNCVGITKVKGSKIDKWVCPNCRKKNKTEKETLQTPVAARGRRGSGQLKSSQKGVKGTGRKLATPGDKEGGKDKTQPTPEKLRRRQTTGESLSPRLPPDDTQPSSEKCIICKTKPSRKDSIFCSDECVVKHSHETGSGPATSTSLTKLKRSNSKVVADKEELENFLTFHLIQPGAPKSTVVVPPKPKELTASCLVKQGSPTKSSSAAESSPSISSTNGKPSSASDKSSSVGVKRGSESQGTGETKRTKLTEATPVSSKRSTSTSASSGTRSRTHASSVKSSTSTSSEGKPTRKRILSETTDSKSKQKDSEKPKKETEKQRKETEAEIAAYRQRSRSKLTEVFQTRLTELTEIERSEIPAQNTPEAISMAIEAELFNSFASAHTKYKNKFRSILFNVTDSKNSLYKRISMNELKPKELVKLEPHQLASDELAQWRINESKKELEMIKRSEIDKLEELKKQERIDAELGFEKISNAMGEEEARSLGTGHADRKAEGSEAGTPSRASTRSSSRHKSSHHGHSKSTDKETTPRSHSGKTNTPKRDSKDSNANSTRRTRSSEKGVDKKINTPKKEVSNKEDKKALSKSSSKPVSSSSRHSSSRSGPSIQENVSTPKDKDSSTTGKSGELNLRSRDHQLRSFHKRPHSESEHRTDSSGKEKRKDSKKQADKMEAKITSGDDKTSRRKETNLKDSALAALSDDVSGSTILSTDDSPSLAEVQSTGVADSNLELRVSIDSVTEQELPSSTIKTPDFTTEEISTLQSGDTAEAQKPVLESSFSMLELGSFNAVLYNVSHFSLDGIFFPSSPVPIVGRIHPNVVWDYIDKMKKTKEVIILRLAPATPADTEGYMTFFTYFSSRTRLGVVGGRVSPLKDVYLVPLDKHSPVNKVLLPFHGPGLPKKRAHCLLAVITRHSVDIPTPLSRRKPSLAESSSKRMKLTSDIKPGLISSLNLTAGRDRRGGGIGSSSSASKKSPDDKISPVEEETNESSQVNDDDLPYTPWEEEDGSSPVSTGVTSHPVIPPVKKSKKVITDPKILMQIQELEAKIQEEQAAIENIELAIIAKTHEDPLLIPGLDGEFAAEESGGLPSFLRPSTKPRAESTGEVPKATENLFPIVPLSLASGESSAVPPEVKEVPEVIELDEEEDDAPYSPSQLDLDETES